MKPPWIRYDEQDDRVVRDSVVPETAVRLMPCPYPMTDAEIAALHDSITIARRNYRTEIIDVETATMRAYEGMNDMVELTANHYSWSEATENEKAKWRKIIRIALGGEDRG